MTIVGNSSASPSRFAAMDESAVAKDTSPLSISPLAEKKIIVAHKILLGFPQER